jgi:chorismate synthase
MGEENDIVAPSYTKGFEFGSGFDGTKQRGSAHNDQYVPCAAADASDGITTLKTKTNNAGGTLGGISNGEDMFFRVAVKPVSTIGQAQQTAAYNGAATVLEAKGRHDPCVLPRTPPLVRCGTRPSVPCGYVCPGTSFHIALRDGVDA